VRSVVVCANFDGFAMTHWPEDPTLQPQFEKVVAQLVDPFIGRKMAPMFMCAGLVDLKIDFEPDRLFTIIGAIDPDRRSKTSPTSYRQRDYTFRRYLAANTKLTNSLPPSFATTITRTRAAYTTLYFVRGTVP